MPNNKKAFMVTKEQNKGQIRIYSDIGDTYWWEYGSDEFRRELEALGDVSEIDVYINSDGGEVSAATAIYSQLRAHKAKITTYVDGIAASAASLIFMAGDKRIMREASILMIHNPGLSAYGTSKQLRAAADFLDKLKEAVLTAYNRADITEDEISKLMDEETWMTAADALERGFATEVDTFSPKLDLEIDNNVLMVKDTKIDVSKNKQFNTFYMKNAKMFKTKNMKENEENMTQEELKSRNPEMYLKIKEEGAIEERQRIKEIEEAGIPGTEVIMKKFKYEEPKTAEMFSKEVLKMVKAGEISIEPQEGKKQKNDMENLKDAQMDAKKSGVQNIPGSTGKSELTPEEKAKMRAERIAAKINKNRGY
ncbi:Clp protease [Cetobacterium ceti]|uniref:ATP-dependent Clp protease proteolytic subunit n=1 Tax=Cetobacterium ceti TaxID=180163 RepID=A0A1T4PUT8_9FUSO|nr:head maturation protease, ClpP-related [Cetobacterium ceti]SJZ95324.1 Clp protease [Cetobacterium ceti]